MTYTYTWTDADQTTLRREDSDGNVAFVPTDPANRDYAEFLSSGAKAVDYVAPPAPPEPTLDENLKVLGITVEDLRRLIGR